MHVAWSSASVRLLSSLRRAFSGAALGLLLAASCPGAAAPVLAPAAGNAERGAAVVVRRVRVGAGPQSIARAFGGHFAVTLLGPRRVRGDGDGAIVLLAGGRVLPLAAGLDNPRGLAFTGTEVITADFDRVWGVGAQGNRRLVAGPRDFPRPPVCLADVVLMPDGEGVWVADVGAEERMFAAPRVLRPLGTPEARALPALGCVYGVAVEGRVTIEVDREARLPLPNGLAFSAAGALYIGESFLGTLYEWKVGAWRCIGDDYRGVEGLAVDRCGRLYVSEAFSGRVWRVDPASGVRRLLATLRSAGDLLVDDAAGELAVPDPESGEIVFLRLPD